ncbi:MAG: hypothetical protein ACRDM7_17130 [Thermoleophilaceae bacterium]
MNFTSQIDAWTRLPDPSWADDRAWKNRLARDQARASNNQTPDQRTITNTVVNRALAIGAEGIALTGSTARNRRTLISDLDYHVVGERPRVDDLPGDVDVYAGDAAQFWEKLRAGDDFVQWTVRYGCILHDSGILRAGLEAIAEDGIWPDATDRMARLGEQSAIARRLIEMGDRDAAQSEVRAALTSAARGVLLAGERFPLARSELPGQLRCIGHDRLADSLDAAIHREPSLDQLAESLAVLPAPVPEKPV